MDRRKPAKGARRPSMAAVIATGDGTAGGSSHISASTNRSSHLSLISKISLFKDSTPVASDVGKALISLNDHEPGWIIDSGATAHMTYDKSLFQYTTPLRQDQVITGNGDIVHVTGVGSIALTPFLSLHHTLLISTLSNNLLSISQVTEQLDCIVLMFPMFCLLQDI